MDDTPQEHTIRLVGRLRVSGQVCLRGSWSRRMSLSLANCVQA